LSPESPKENRAFPLELVNILRHAPSGLFWESQHDNSKLRRLRGLGIAEWSVSESAKTIQSRELLRAFCHREYEPGNQELIRRLGWCTDHFVPFGTVSSFTETLDLTELDRLWEPDSSAQEQELLFNALRLLVEADDTEDSPTNRMGGILLSRLTGRSGRRASKRR
jgi:hypothetical protein